MKKITLFFLLAVAFVTVQAQKLPNIQQVSLRVPENVKIDGKIAEWGDKFLAYNNANKFYYTIANDNENLYLAVQMDDFFGTNKIFRGGLSFTIASGLKKSVNTSLTYPAISQKLTPELDRLQNSYYVFKRFLVDTVANKTKIDSLTAAVNTQMDHLFKVFQLTETKQGAAKIIPIYNENGISLKCRVDSK